MRECQKRASKKWDASNNDKIREYKRNYYQRNKIEIKIRRLTKDKNS